MLFPLVRPPGLITGERMNVEEFLRRWEALADVKNAELIDTVQMRASLNDGLGSEDDRCFIEQLAAASR